MDRVRNFTEAELSQEEKDDIGLLVSKNYLDPKVWTVENFPDEFLLRVCKRALKEQQGFVPNSATTAKRKEQFVFELCSVEVATFSEGTTGSIRGEQLLVKSLPNVFLTRYGCIPEKIYVRDAYRTLYDRAAQTRIRQQTGTHCATLFTGVPGIGKSLFLVYFLYRFLTDESIKDKRFALEFTRGVYMWFEPSGAPGEFWCSIEDGVRMDPKEFLLLCDIDDAMAPVSRAQWTYIFSSPNPARYKEIIKNWPSQRFTLPTWSELELLFVSADIDSWYEAFVLFGGVPRYLFPQEDTSHTGSTIAINPYTLMEKALGEKGGAISESFFKYGFGTVDSQQSYLLVHINPSVSAAGEVDYDGVTKYTFASDAVFQRLVQKHRDQLLAGATGMFNAGAASETYGAVSAGHLFEKICLWLTPIDGTRFTALSLSGDSYAEFEVPPVRELLPHDWKKTARLVPDVLYVPRISNLESGDSFYLVGLPEGGYQLVVLQMTVGTSHPVKSNGLLTILFAYEEDVRLQVACKALVFVLPEHGRLDEEQALHTQKEEPINIAHVPVAVRDFQQYVYRHKISEATDIRPTAAATGSLKEPLAQSGRGAAREPTAGRESGAKRSRPIKDAAATAAPAGASKAARTDADRDARSSAQRQQSTSGSGDARSTA
eukprot:gene3572-2591_t